MNLHVWLVQDSIGIAIMYCRLYRMLHIAVVATAWAGFDSVKWLTVISVILIIQLFSLASPSRSAHHCLRAALAPCVRGTPGNHAKIPVVFLGTHGSYLYQSS